jgi:hypothetical protein
MEAGDKGLDKAQEAPEAGDQSGAPPDPKQLAGALLQQLRDIPWMSLGAIGTGVGVLLLYAYFQSIDFMPSDIPSILGASVFVALLLLGSYLVVVGSLIAPLWMFRELGLSAEPAQVHDKTRRLLRLGLPGLQFLGVGLFLLYLGAQGVSRCDAFASWFIAVGGCLAALGAMAWAAAEWASIGQRPAWWRRLLPLLGVCVFSTLPFWVVVQLLTTGEGLGWWSLGLGLVVWLAVVFGSRWERMPVWAYALMVTALTVLFTLSLPLLHGHSAQVPARVAQLAGIRGGQVDELRIPQSTCRLIQSAIGDRSGFKAPLCDGGEWGTAHARVLSSFGPRWLIELQTAAPQDASQRLRLTIPGDSVHMVRPQPAAPRNACPPALPKETAAASPSV